MSTIVPVLGARLTDGSESSLQLLANNETLISHILLQPPLVQAIFNRNAEEVQLLLHKKEDVNALVCFFLVGRSGGWGEGGSCCCNYTAMDLSPWVNYNAAVHLI